MSWLPESAPGETPFESILGLRANLLADHRAFDRLLWSGRPVDPALLELCRLRIARLHGCDAELRIRRTDALPDAKREIVERVERSAGRLAAGTTAPGDVFSPLEAAVVALAEKFALEPHGVSDADVAAVTSRVTPAEFVALVEGMAMSDGFARFQVLLGVGATGDASPYERSSDASETGVAGDRARATRAMRVARDERVPAATPRLAAPEPLGRDAISGSVLAHQPELLRAFLRLYGTLWSDGVVDHPTKEVLRLRNARVTDCNYCKNVRFSEARRQGLDEAMVAQIDDDYEESSLSERHKVALRLADAFLVDPRGLDASARAALLAHYTPAEIVEMTAGLALFMGFSKITVVLGREPVSMPTTVVPTPVRSPDGDESASSPSSKPEAG